MDDVIRQRLLEAAALVRAAATTPEATAIPPRNTLLRSVLTSKTTLTSVMVTKSAKIPRWDAVGRFGVVMARRLATGRQQFGVRAPELPRVTGETSSARL